MRNPFSPKKILGNNNPFLETRGGKHTSKAILRRIVFKRDKGICRLCGIKLRINEIWDLARNRAGQPYTEKNCFVAHHDCNISQGRKTILQTKKGLGLIKKKQSKPTKRKSRFVNPFWPRMPKIKIRI